jgi:hypothetical protein
MSDTLRHPHGASSTAWVFDVAGDGVTPFLVAGSSVTGWTAQTSGSQYTDLLAADFSTAIDHVLTSDGTDGYTVGQIPLFYSPAGISGMWISADGGPRVWLPANDIDQRLITLEDTIDDLLNRMGGAEARLALAAMFVNQTGTDPWSTRPDIAADNLLLWAGQTNPGIGGGYMRDNLDIFVDRTP